MSNLIPTDSAGRIPPISLSSGAVSLQAYPRAFFVSTSIAARVAWNALEATVYDSNNVPLTFRGTYASRLNSDVYITNSGVEGLDTGSEAANTWYYLWLISDGATLHGMLSASYTAPVMPSGYTYKRLVGAYRNNASSNFIYGYQVGTLFEYVPTTPQLYSEATNAGSNVSRDCSPYVPPLSKLVCFNGIQSATYSVASMAYSTSRIGVYNGGTGNLTHVLYDHQFYQNAGSIQTVGEVWSEIDGTGQVITYHASLGANRTSYSCSLNIAAYVLTEI